MHKFLQVLLQASFTNHMFVRPRSQSPYDRAWERGYTNIHYVICFSLHAIARCVPVPAPKEVCCCWCFCGSVICSRRAICCRSVRAGFSSDPGDRTLLSGVPPAAEVLLRRRFAEPGFSASVSGRKGEIK